LGERVIEKLPRRDAVADAGTNVRTFLIADMRGYTRFTLEHGDTAAANLATAFAKLKRDAVAARGGDVIELRGDEALAVFSSTRQALWPATELQGQLSLVSTRDPGASLKVGIGIDAGEAVPIEGGFRGAALNLAARLCSLAGPGEVLVTEAITHLARKVEGLEYVERGAMDLKGFAEPVTVLEVRPVRDKTPGTSSLTSSKDTSPDAEDVSEGANRPTIQTLPIGGFLGALPSGLIVAREGELKRALSSIDAVDRGRGRLLLLTGEPGVGKTRLAQEITLNLRNRDFFVAAGSSYEARMSSAYYPWVDVLSTLYRLAAPNLRSQVAQRFPYLAKLLPKENLQTPVTGDGQEEQDRLFWSVTGFLQALAETRPLALLLDDLHWADGSTRDQDTCSKKVSSYCDTSLVTPAAIVCSSLQPIETSRLAVSTRWKPRSVNCPGRIWRSGSPSAGSTRTARHSCLLPHWIA
jgi:class 3 adenylate cyclase